MRKQAAADRVSSCSVQECCHLCQLVISLFAKITSTIPPKNVPQPAACGAWQLSNCNKEEMIFSLHPSVACTNSDAFWFSETHVSGEAGICSSRNEA